MKICLVTTFPPSGRQLNEYALHLAGELQRHRFVDLTILADELGDYKFASDGNGNGHGNGMRSANREELPGFNVIRCWKFNNLATPQRLLRAIQREKPDVVWYNLLFSTFATQEHPLPAFAGLCVPALSRALGHYSHVTLHHIIEHVDFAGTGIRHEKVFRFGSDLATRALLKANSVSVLLSGYRRTLLEKYSAQNVLLGTHGIFATCPTPPDFSKRNNPEQRILAIGHWGTYKRLETLMAAFPSVLKRVPNARLIVAGSNHHTTPGYWESIKEAHHDDPGIEFLGYVPEEKIAELFGKSSVMVMPYDSSTGSSGPAHQACQYGVPIICSDIPDFQVMARDDEMAISFCKPGDPADLAERIVEILQSPEQQQEMAEQNFRSAVRMTMPTVVRHYLRWFELERCKQTIGSLQPLSFRRWRHLARRSKRMQPAPPLKRDLSPKLFNARAEVSTPNLFPSNGQARSEPL
ncbi:MAG TPA: glycosyltransferase [Terriglobales bacterium]|nr:glycosyltransferase [Terriglobales bacterium]